MTTATTMSLAHRALDFYDQHGEYTMLCWLMTKPTSAENRNRWLDNGIMFLPDGSEVSHQAQRYQFGQPQFGSRDARLKAAERPSPPVSGEEFAIPVAFYDPGYHRAMFNIQGQPLQALVTGWVSQKELNIMVHELEMSADQVIGLNRINSDPAINDTDILRPERAHRYLDDFASAITVAGLSRSPMILQPKPFEELDLRQRADLLELCNRALEHDWSLHQEALRTSSLFSNAALIASVMQLPADTGA